MCFNSDSLGRNENTHGYAEKTRRKTTWEW